MKEQVWIASANPVKIKAAEKGFSIMMPGQGFDFFGKGVESGISEQPKGLTETCLGAQNRIRNLKNIIPGADYYVGIEGGIRQQGDHWFAFAWVVVESGDGLLGKAQTGHFMLPSPVVELIQKGYELGHADDIIFGTENSKQKSGAVGILTDNIIDRSEYYLHAMILALIPFKKRDLFF